ncbi:MAG: hypothetical protein CYPHOPRED_002530 [Cyphobasidiales sp. Tagirdzhanova-0007]|nr:MAG: hypothetical protein CYPHOPRED_002530 [Cyphobasidiales sp. Tagirdzhanova-0007]
MLANDNESREITGLESQIQSLLESLLELGICATDVHPSALEPPNEPGGSSTNGIDGGVPFDGISDPAGLVGKKVQETTQAMSALYNAHTTFPKVNELLLPDEVIDYVDQGRNPDIYTHELIERVAGENMYTNGIIDAIGSYQRLLAKEMQEAFPSMKIAIQALGIDRQEPAPVSTLTTVKSEDY